MLKLVFLDVWLLAGKSSFKIVGISFAKILWARATSLVSFPLTRNFLSVFSCLIKTHSFAFNKADFSNQNLTPFET